MPAKVWFHLYCMKMFGAHFEQSNTAGEPGVCTTYSWSPSPRHTKHTQFCIQAEKIQTGEVLDCTPLSQLKKATKIRDPTPDLDHNKKSIMLCASDSIHSPPYIQDNYPRSDKEHNPTTARIQFISSCRPTECFGVFFSLVVIRRDITTNILVL